MNPVSKMIRDALIYFALFMLTGWKITLGIFIAHWLINVLIAYRAGKFKS